MRMLSDADLSVMIDHVQDDIDSTELWESAMREQGRREQQRKRMVKWRRQKKEKGAELLQERLRLEKELESRVVQERMRSESSPPQLIGHAFRQVTVECAALKRENLALKEAIEVHSKFNSLARIEAQELEAQMSRHDGAADPPAKDIQRLEREDGWPVNFPNGDPSFYFSPFSKTEFDTILRNSGVAYAERHPCTATVGKILGWTVDHAPLTLNTTGTSFVAHARFTRRLRCSLDYSEQILPRLDKRLWPVLVTPRSWGHVQFGDTCCQLLQSIHENAHVMACNIPGDVNLRYLVLAQHTRERTSDGKRVDKYIMTIADSDANARNREAEGHQKRVQWVMEGGVNVIITEIDDSTIDVVFDQWAESLSEMHGRELYVDWVRFPVRLEQSISSARLL
ncbi:Phospholipase D [Phytophthora cinnamomi]|uniref:Phospholipase D n=1 Tax=Phytophthora cinnamomi TaxID=4785 RepID=UPI003559F723|nr:Phospholipase D [Phytophthora cinnamomi]